MERLELIIIFICLMVFIIILASYVQYKLLNEVDQLQCIIYPPSYHKIIIEYDNAQSQEGKLKLEGEEIHFNSLEVSGDRLIVYISDNGWSKKGRIGHTFDLNKYEIEVKN